MSKIGESALHVSHAARSTLISHASKLRTGRTNLLSLTQLEAAKFGIVLFDGSATAICHGIRVPKDAQQLHRVHEMCLLTRVHAAYLQGDFSRMIGGTEGTDAALQAASKDVGSVCLRMTITA
eukprot:3575852-Amphidinium_carterae.1